MDNILSMQVFQTFRNILHLPRNISRTHIHFSGFLPREFEGYIHYLLSKTSCFRSSSTGTQGRVHFRVFLSVCIPRRNAIHLGEIAVAK